MIRLVPPTKFDLDIIIEWPDWSGAPLSGRSTRVLDAHTEVLIDGIGAMTLYATPGQIVWAGLEMYADEEGDPIVSGNPVYKNNEIVTAVFAARIFEIRSKRSWRKGFGEGADKKISHV